MAKADRKGRSKGATIPFVQVFKSTLQEPAWKSLPYGARCLYIQIKTYFTGANNGRLYLSVRKAADELGASSTSTERWFRDLIEHGFIVPTAGGFLGAEGKGTATYWRLTELGFNGEQPTRNYKDWPDLKNRIPSQKKGHPVPKIGTPVPKIGTVLTRKHPLTVPKIGTYLIYHLPGANGPDAPPAEPSP